MFVLLLDGLVQQRLRLLVGHGQRRNVHLLIVMLPVHLLLLLLLQFFNQRIIVVVQRLVGHRVRGGHIDNLAAGGGRGRQVHRFDGGGRNDDRTGAARIQTVRVIAVAISNWDFEQLYVGAQMMEATAQTARMIGHVIGINGIVVVQRCRRGDNRTGLIQVMDNVLGGRFHGRKVRRSCRNVGAHLVVVRLWMMILMLLVAVVLVVLRLAVMMWLKLLMVGHLIDGRIIGRCQYNTAGRHDGRNRSQQTEQIVTIIIDDAAVMTTVTTDARVASCNDGPHIADLLMLQLRLLRSGDDHVVRSRR